MVCQPPHLRAEIGEGADQGPLAHRVHPRLPEVPGPVGVEAVVDPFEPPLPAKITLDQAKNFAISLLRGEPKRDKIALTVLGDRVRELV